MSKFYRITKGVGISIIGLLFMGCSGEVQLQLRDAAVSAAATFIEQETLQLLNSAFGGVNE